MRLLVILLVYVVGVVYFNSSHASNLPNSVKGEETFIPFVLDIDCDFNPDTNEVYNCKVEEKANEQ